MKDTLKSASATAVKNRFGDYLGEVLHGERSILIEKHGRPVAVLVSYENWTHRREEKGSDPWLQAYEQLAKKIEQDEDAGKTTAKSSAVDLIRTLREEES